ncbi:hypothetical protein ARMGADRAFT_782587 [Armillaria gallica]|uniref:Uncharacterized protein n=1 Tax=Armillaria gallica TaxID=47427 RepID=A0A2H3CE73_ARMGA|nr:hypothetical protein ARMGADRAFT_782587 [Armillaria gallica]
MTTANDSAYVGAYLSTFLYGAYIVIAYHCSLVLYHRYKTKRLHMYLLGTHIALFILITWRSTTTIARTLYGVFHLTPDGTIDLYPWSTWSLVENVPWALTIIVADVFLIYRTYVVWMQKYLVIVLPLLLFAADVGAAIYLLFRIGTSTTTFVQLTNATTIFAAMALAANIVCTALLSFCIWMVRRNISETRQGLDPLSGVIALVVESAAVCTVLLIAQVITLGLRSPIHNVLFDIQAPIIGIVFSMIIIRVSRGEVQGSISAITDGSIVWHRSTTEETATNIEARLREIGAHSDDVGAQQKSSKISTETNIGSTRFKS